MVEIFTVRIGQDEAATRAVGNEIALSGPSNVYFGTGAAGIAYYEKSGADLRVTLLDGQEILVRDFFVIGEMGEYSRLLDGGAAGEIEVTGLIAPEPFVPPSDTPPATVVMDEKADTAEPLTTETADDGEVVVEVMGEGDAQPVDETAATGGGAAGGLGTFAGIGLDKLLFFAAYTPAIISITDDENGSGGAPAGNGDVPPAGEEPTEGEGEAETPVEEGSGDVEDEGETPDTGDDGLALADLLNGLLGDPDGPSVSEALFGSEDTAFNLGEFIVDVLDPLATLLDDLQSASQSA